MPSSCSIAGPGASCINGPHPRVGTVPPVGGSLVEHPVVETTL